MRFHTLIVPGRQTRTAAPRCSGWGRCCRVPDPGPEGAGPDGWL